MCKGTSTDLCNVLYSFLSLNVLNKYNFYKTYNNNSLLFHYYVILPYKVKRTSKIRGRNTP